MKLLPRSPRATRPRRARHRYRAATTLRNSTLRICGAWPSSASSLRRFLHVSQAAAEQMGLRNQQYQLLQCVGGMPEGMAPTIANVAARMLLKHNSAVELVDRTIEQGLLRRSGDAADHRRILLRVTPQGERILASLAEFHTRELEQSGPELVRALNRVLHAAGAAKRAAARAVRTKGGRAMSLADPQARQRSAQLRDFNAGPRMIMLSGLGLILGVAGAALAWILLHLIYACTNLFYYQRLSWSSFRRRRTSCTGWRSLCPSWAASLSA